MLRYILANRKSIFDNSQVSELSKHWYGWLSRTFYEQRWICKICRCVLAVDRRTNEIRVESESEKPLKPELALIDISVELASKLGKESAFKSILEGQSFRKDADSFQSPVAYHHS